jgi:hypothetical protein
VYPGVTSKDRWNDSSISRCKGGETLSTFEKKFDGNSHIFQYASEWCQKQLKPSGMILA